jgi:hypothetical protein
VVPNAKAVPEWEQIYLDSRSNRDRFKITVGAYDLLVYSLFIWAVHSGRPWWSLLAELLTSQIPLLTVRYTWEDKDENETRSRKQRLIDTLKTLNPRTQSWAFLADFVGLGPMQAVASLAYPHLPHNALFNGTYWWAWVVISFVVGIAISWGFRKGEAKGYNVLRYFSFTKLLHNGVAFTVLCAMIVHTLVPIVLLNWSATWPYSGWVLAFFLVWLVFGVGGDMIRGNLRDDHPLKLKGENLHPETDARGRRIRRDLGPVPTMYEYKTKNPDLVNDWFDLLQPPRLGRIIVDFVRPLVTRPGRSATMTVAKDVEPPRTGYDERPPDDPGPRDGPNEPG